eukprot:545013-Rhodomonas_salina.1
MATRVSSGHRITRRQRTDSGHRIARGYLLVLELGELRQEQLPVQSAHARSVPDRAEHWPADCGNGDERGSGGPRAAIQ